MPTESIEVAVIGAGVAGLSAAAALSRDANVRVLERESQPAYHTSGRSAAMYIEAYENPTVYALTCASLAYFENPVHGESSLLTPRGSIMVANEATLPALQSHLDAWGPLVPGLNRLAIEDAARMAPVIRPEWLVGASLDTSVQGIDVHGLLQSFQRTLRANGGTVSCGQEVVELVRRGGVWNITLASAEGSRSELCAEVVVNAAGAWGGVIGDLARASRIPLEPRRRTALLIDPPEQYSGPDQPLLYAASGDLYLKPEAGQVMVSPADETPSAPCDARPEELDVAVSVDRLQQLTTIEVSRVPHSWAGLRSFCPDRRHCAGYDTEVEGFFWLVGQGGCGVQTAPAMGELTRALVRREAPPAFLVEHGVRAEEISPARF